MDTKKENPVNVTYLMVAIIIYNYMIAIEAFIKGELTWYQTIAVGFASSFIMNLEFLLIIGIIIIPCVCLIKVARGQI